MDSLKKFLRGLSKKEQEVFSLLIIQIKKDYKRVPHLLKLKGMENFYRIRFGRYRIIFKIENGIAEIRRITKRDDQTYRNL